MKNKKDSLANMDYFKNLPFNLDQYTSDKQFVIEFQTLLTQAGFNPGTIDGIWGNKSESAFQQAAKTLNLNTGKTRVIGQFFIDGLLARIPKIRKINQAGLDLIKHFEGLRLTAYYDVINVLTIGYGSTGSHVKPNMKITEAQAESLLKSDLVRFEKAVNNLVKVPLTDNQFAALVSFCFNLGAGALESSTLLRVLNSGNYKQAAEEFLKWNKAGGRILPGLTRRREAEKKLFLT